MHIAWCITTFLSIKLHIQYSVVSTSEVFEDYLFVVSTAPPELLQCFDSGVVTRLVRKCGELWVA